MSKPKISVILTARNEFPIVVGTMLSFYEELVHFDYPFEFVLVDNLSTDSTAEIFEDRFRRWVKNGLLKVVRYNDRGANVLVRNIGARHATGDLLVISDAHNSVKTGTVDRIARGWQEHGGLWHSAHNIWGDTSDIRCYGYKLMLEEKFWGNMSRHLPPSAFVDGRPRDPRPLKEDELQPYNVPMASHCCIFVGREEYLDFGGYCEKFRVYGGGEPYLDLKWWLFGSKVWLEPRGLIRHAFGVNAVWRRCGRDRTTNSAVYTRDGRITRELKSGDEHLHYSRGYSWTNEMLHFNFMLSAYCVGGYNWLQKMYQRYWEIRKINPRYLADLKNLRREVLSEGQQDRDFIASRQKLSLDELLVQQPWS
jgi:glycosyltransferase involved in cell wall biosynthesis